MKKSVKNFFRRGDFTPFMSKSFPIWDNFFPLFFPKNSENLKSLVIGLWEVGAINRQTAPIQQNPAQQGKIHPKANFFCGAIYTEMDKLLESSKSSSLNLQALSSKLGLVQNEIQA